MAVEQRQNTLNAACLHSVHAHATGGPLESDIHFKGVCN